MLTMTVIESELVSNTMVGLADGRFTSQMIAVSAATAAMTVACVYLLVGLLNWLVLEPIRFMVLDWRSRREAQREDELYEELRQRGE